jgi:diguanylate cyclase (GGDEF)-like protein
VSYGWTLYGWALWHLPGRAVLLVVGVEAAAGALLLTTAGAVGHTQLALAGLLALLGVVHTEVATGIDRIRRRAAETTCFNLSSVWTFAAALLLPPVPAVAVIVIVYLHLWQRVWRRAVVPLHRLVYTVASVVLAAGAAHAVVAGGALPVRPGDLVGVAVVAAAVLVYVVVTQLLEAGIGTLTSDRPSVGDLAGRWDSHALELATTCLGALTAIALAAMPGLVVLVLPPILVLHRAVRVRQLEQAVATDAKTGLLTAAAWRIRAEEAIRRAGRTRGAVAVLVLDLDHFKAVNDEYGHLAGDEVLAAVAGELRTGVRQHDLVGRFGGEEFVVLLPDLAVGAGGRAELSAVAERLRRRIAELQVSVADGTPGRVVDGSAGIRTITTLSISVGGATVPTDGRDLDEVLRSADASLYAAKRAGRNLVRIAARAEVPAPRRPTA